jgi:hypothetical protein
VLPWVREAGEPYYSWFFGRIVPADRLESILADWMRRRSSEVSVERAVLLLIGDRAVGGFIGLGGADLQPADGQIPWRRCRRPAGLDEACWPSGSGRARTFSPPLPRMSST